MCVMTQKILDNKVIFITGASSGIGRATAKLCASKGGTVIVTARRKEYLESLASEISHAGGKVCIHTMDVTSDSDVKRVIRLSIEEFGRIDVLINNAGKLVLGPIHKTSVKQFEDLINVNLLGVHRCCTAVIPHMIQNKSGHIINISSIVGLVPYSLGNAYAASKSGLVSYSHSLRAELFPAGIHVSTLCPGQVKTDIRKIAHSVLDREISKGSAHMMQSPETIAAQIVGCILQPKRTKVSSILLWLYWKGYQLMPGVMEWFARRNLTK